MTYSATPLHPTSFKDIRARLTFTAREDSNAPRLATRLRSRPPWLLMVGGLVAGAAVLSAVALARHTVSTTLPVAPLAPVVAAPTAPAWTDIIRPFTAYDLAGGPYARLPLAYAARRDAGGTARQDVLTYGAPVPGGSFLRLMFYRRGDEPVPAATVFVDAARLAAGAGLAVTRSGLTSELATRFGTVDVAGVTVAAPDRSATCLAFRLADPGTTPVLQLAGLACGSDEKPVDLAAVACTIEKVDLVSAGDDEDLRAVFVAAERHRGLGCREERGGGLRPGLPDEPRQVRSALKGPL